MGWTALMAASFNDRLECVKYLLTLPDIDLHCREYVSSKSFAEYTM